MAADEAWFKGCKTKAQREARLKELKSYQTAFTELREVLKGKFTTGPCYDYSNPTWSMEQVRRNEAQKLLDTVEKLTNL